MELITAQALDSPARVADPVRSPVVAGLVQTRWHADPDEHEQVLAGGIRMAAEAGARVVFLPELTLSRYPADTVPTGRPSAAPVSRSRGTSRSSATTTSRSPRTSRPH
jgi:N-carbamoylputrescine amidase